MFTLFASDDAGVSYYQDREAKTLDELRPRMAELDEKGLRWCLEKDGKEFSEEGSVCSIHLEVFQSLESLR